MICREIGQYKLFTELPKNDLFNWKIRKKNFRYKLPVPKLVLNNWVYHFPGIAF